MAFVALFISLVFATSLTEASPCYSGCVFKQCVESAVSLSAPSDQPQLPALCRNGRAIGVATSGRAFLFDIPAGTLTSTFPDIFKTQSLSNGSAALSVTAASRRHANTVELQSTCVVLSIRYVQILDASSNVIDNLNLPEKPETNCVAFRTSASSEPTPSNTFPEQPSFDPEELVTPQVTSITESPTESATPPSSDSDEGFGIDNTIRPEPSNAPELSASPIAPTVTLVATAEPDAGPLETVSTAIDPDTPEPSMPITHLETTLVATPGPDDIPSESVPVTEELDSPEPSSIPVTSTTATADNTPDVEVTDGNDEPSGAPETLSTDEEGFRAKTSRSGDKLSYSTQVSANGSTFDYSFSATLRSSGVVSLESALEDVVSISCSENSVSVELSDSYMGASAQVLFPIEAVLVVNPDVFSGCSFGPETKIFGDFPDSETNLIGDEVVDHSARYHEGYLVVKSVVRQGRLIVIEGVPSPFAAAFDEGELLLNLVTPDTNTTARQVEHSSATLPALSRETKIPFEQDLAGIIKLTGELVYEFKGSLDSFKYSWGVFGVTIETIVTADFDVTAAISAALSVGVKSPVIPLVKLVSFPIPELGLAVPIDTSTIKGDFKLPPLKLGLFFEVPLILTVDVSITKNIFSSKVFKYSLGKKRYLLKAQGIPPTFLPTTVDLLSSEESTRSVTWDFDNKFFNEPLFASLDVFIGIRPQLALYIGPFVASISAKVGVSIKGERAVATNGQSALVDAFPPDTKGIGVCDTCHISKISVSGFVGGAGLYGKLTPVSLLFLDGKFTKALNTLTTISLFKLTLPGKPITSLIQQVCLEPQFGDDTVTCDKKCCDGSTGQQCVAVGQAQVCDTSPSPAPPIVKTAATFTDPHFFTFDQRPFSCQASGEFIMASSQRLGEEVQARFSGPDASGSVMTGVSLKSSAGSTVQLSVALVNSTTNIVLGLCSLAIFANGVQEPSVAAANNKLIDLSIEVSGAQFTLSLPSGAVFKVAPSVFPSFGCFFSSFSMSVPVAPNDNDWIGLLGSPNDNEDDDWMYRNGTALKSGKTASERMLVDAYDYCSQNWCIRNETESLFTYEAGTRFNTFFRCDDRYEEVDFTRASDELQQLCGDNVECLVDGIVFGEDLARVTLEVQQDLSGYTPGNLSDLPVRTPVPVVSLPPSPQLPVTPLPTIDPISSIPNFRSNFSFVQAEVNSEQIVGLELTLQFGNMSISNLKVFNLPLVVNTANQSFQTEFQAIGNATICNFSTDPLVESRRVIDGVQTFRYLMRIKSGNSGLSSALRVFINYLFVSIEQDELPGGLLPFFGGSFAFFNGNGERVKFDKITATGSTFNDVPYNGPDDSVPLQGREAFRCFFTGISWGVPSLDPSSFFVSSILF